MSTKAGQLHFRRLLEQHTNLHRNITRKELVAIKRVARGSDPELDRRIGRILTLEALLAPCDVIFGLLQTQHGQIPARIAESLRERWGERVPFLDTAEFAEIRDEIISLVGADITVHMARTYDGLLRGDYETAIGQLLEWNRLVMTHRSAALTLESRKFTDESGPVH